MCRKLLRKVRDRKNFKMEEDTISFYDNVCNNVWSLSFFMKLVLCWVGKGNFGDIISLLGFKMLSRHEI